MKEKLIAFNNLMATYLDASLETKKAVLQVSGFKRLDNSLKPADVITTDIAEYMVASRYVKNDIGYLVLMVLNKIDTSKTEKELLENDFLPELVQTIKYDAIHKDEFVAIPQAVIESSIIDKKISLERNKYSHMNNNFTGNLNGRLFIIQQDNFDTCFTFLNSKLVKLFAPNKFYQSFSEHKYCFADNNLKLIYNDRGEQITANDVAVGTIIAPIHILPVSILSKAEQVAYAVMHQKPREPKIRPDIKIKKDKIQAEIETITKKIIPLKSLVELELKNKGSNHAIKLISDKELWITQKQIDVMQYYIKILKEKLEII